MISGAVQQRDSAFGVVMVVMNDGGVMGRDGSLMVSSVVGREPFRSVSYDIVSFRNVSSYRVVSCRVVSPWWM